MGVGPLVDRLADDLDPIARPQQRPDRPWLVAEDASLELEAADQRAMEDLAVDRRVIHEPRVRRDRLAAGDADIRVVVALRDPAPLAVVLDPLADHGADGRVGGRSHQRIERAREQQVVGIEEGQPLAADELEATVAGVGDAAVGRQPDAGRRVGRAAAIAATSSAVPSVEASSTTTTSSGIARSTRTESRARSTVVAAFQVGTRIESRGASGAARRRGTGGRLAQPDGVLRGRRRP